MARGLSCSHQLAGSGTRLDGVEDRENSICKENNGKQGGSFREVRGGQWFRWEEMGPEITLICGCFDVSGRISVEWLNPSRLSFFTSFPRSCCEVGVSYVDAWH